MEENLLLSMKYWLQKRGSLFHGFLVYYNPHIIGWNNPLYNNPTNQGLFHRSSVQSSDWGEVGSFIFVLYTLFHAKCLKYVSKGAKTKTVEQTAEMATNFPWFCPPLSKLPSTQGYSSSLHVVRGTRHCIGIRINRHGSRITQASGCVGKYGDSADLLGFGRISIYILSAWWFQPI